MSNGTRDFLYDLLTMVLVLLALLVVQRLVG